MKKITLCAAVVLAFTGIMASSALAGHPNPPGCKNPVPRVKNPNCNGGNPGGKGHHGHPGQPGGSGGGNGGGQGSPGQPPMAPSEALESVQDNGVALCAPVPEKRADGSVGLYFQVNADTVDDLIANYGFTPAVYVESYGTACAVSDVHVNPADYHLVTGVLATDGGLLFSAADAASEGGDSAIHPYYAHN